MGLNMIYHIQTLFCFFTQLTYYNFLSDLYLLNMLFCSFILFLRQRLKPILIFALCAFIQSFQKQRDIF
jgi:hypothetical protein